MGGMVKRHVLTVILAVAAFALPTLKIVGWLISRGGDADFLISRITDPGWVRDMLTWLGTAPQFLILIVAGFAVIYLDIWWHRRKAVPRTEPHPIKLGPDAFCFTRYVRKEGLNEDTGFYENSYYAAVSNNDPEAKVLKNVSLSTMLHHPAERSQIRGSEDYQLNIRAGDYALFLLGKIVSKKNGGLVEGPIMMSADKLFGYEHNVGRVGCRSFERQSGGLGGKSGDLKENVVWTLLVSVFADDLPAKRAALIIDMSKDPASVTIRDDLAEFNIGPSTLQRSGD